MSSIMDLLAKTTSPQDRFMQLLSLQQMVNPQGGSGAPGSVDPNTPAGSGDPGTGVGPNGDTDYAYTEYNKPYSGVPQGMITRFGVTLQPGPMHSLLDIARASGLMPGAREIGQILQGYRSYDAQAAAYASKPGIAAPPGHSYHGQGLAIDAGWWSEHPKLSQALYADGWNQFDRGKEPWHYSYGVTG